MIKIRLIACIIVALTLLHCKGQTEKGVTYPKEKIMTTDKFDKKKYNRIVEEKRNRGEFDIYNHVEVLSNGYVIESSQAQDNSSSIIIIAPVPAITKTYKDYYENGILKEEVELFLGSGMGVDEIKFGISKYYDETGQLIKTIDESVKYENIKIKPLDVFKILKKEPLFVSLTKEEQIHFKEILSISKKEEDITPFDVHNALEQEVILNPHDREGVKKVFLTLSKDEKIWNVIKDLYPFGQIKLEIDTNSGKVLNRQYNRETRP